MVTESKEELSDWKRPQVDSIRVKTTYNNLQRSRRHKTRFRSVRANGTGTARAQAVLKMDKRSRYSSASVQSCFFFVPTVLAAWHFCLAITAENRGTFPITISMLRGGPVPVHRLYAGHSEVLSITCCCSGSNQTQPVPSVLEGSLGIDI